MDPFVVKAIATGRSRRQVKTATGTINGPNASKRSKQITVGNQFDAPIEEITAEINATRASSLGLSYMPNSATALPEPKPVGLPGVFVPWLTFALLAVLIGVFAMENIFPVTPAVKQAPSLQTLIAMGAFRTAVDNWAMYHKGGCFLSKRGSPIFFNKPNSKDERLGLMDFQSEEAWSIMNGDPVDGRLIVDHAIPVSVLHSIIRESRPSSPEDIEAILLKTYRLGVLTYEED